MDTVGLVERVLRELPEAPLRAAESVNSCGGAEVLRAEARKLGLTPLLAHMLPSFQAPEAELLAARFRTAKLTRLTRVALETLDARGVQAVVLKGVGLAARFYPEVWLRPTSDIDLLVHPRDLDGARAALGLAGYREFEGPAESVFDFSQHCSFAGPDRELVELHFTLVCGFQSKFDSEGLFARSTTIEVERGTVLPVLGLEDALVHMCAHAAHHRFGGAKWLFDLKLLALDSSQGVDWAKCVRLARQARVQSAVGMALWEASRRVRAPIPSEVIAELGPGYPRRVLADLVANVEGVGMYPLSLMLADRIGKEWIKETAARPVERAARLVGEKKRFRALVRRTLLGRDGTN
ncbi:MAG: nucleotidyltransferase family protein [Myxococcales bacterium]